MKKMEFGIVGAGKMGTLYVKILLNVFNISARNLVIFDVDQKRSLEVGMKFGVNVASNLTELARKSDIVIVASSSPSHVPVMIHLISHGVKKIFCEKPLGMEEWEVKDLLELAQENDTKICTAFLINFSAAIAKIVDIMKAGNLVLREASAIWGKNRTGDTRPTPGDLEDESVHAVQILRMLAGVNTQIQKTRVSGLLTYLSYTNSTAQKKAREIDTSFPEVVNSSSFLTHVMTVRQGMYEVEVPMNVQSSYVMAKQARCVYGVLAHIDNTMPKYSFHIDFDVRHEENDNVNDVLTLTRLRDNNVQVFELSTNKIADEMSAFIEYVGNGSYDPRLTTIEEAVTSVSLSATAEKSNAKSGQWIKVEG